MICVSRCFARKPAFSRSISATLSAARANSKSAFALVQIKNYDKAGEQLLKTVELEGTPAGKVDAYTNLAGMYLQSAGNPEKAEAYFAEALKLDPKNEQTLMWLAEVASERRARYTALPSVVEMVAGESSLRSARLLLKKYDKGTIDAPGRLFSAR